MKKGFQEEQSNYLLVLFALIISVSMVSGAYAAAGPGWIKGSAGLVDHGAAADYYSSQQSQAVGQGTVGIAAATLYQTEITPEIQELARALHHDPKLIYEYIHNHVDYVPYYGLLKGATLTYLDGSGNDFDQASLLVALLRESANYNTGIGLVQFAYGRMTIPTYNDANDYDMETWLGLGDLGVSSINVVERTLSDGGIVADPVGATTTMDRVCVRAVIGGTPYILDPAFKKYERIDGIDLTAATGYDKATFLSAAAGTEGSNYVENLSDSGIGAKLDEYTANLVDFLRINYPNASIGEIIGEKKIIAETIVDYGDAVKFPLGTSCTGCGYFDEIDDAYIHTIDIQYGSLSQPVSLSIPEVAGKKLSIRYVANAQAASAAAAAAVAAASTDDNITAIPIDTESSQVSPINMMVLENDLLEVAAQSSGSPEDGGVSAQGFNGTVNMGRVNTDGSTTIWNIALYNPSCSVDMRITHADISNNSSGAYSASILGDSYLTCGEFGAIRVTFSGAGQSRGTKTATYNQEIQYIPDCWGCFPSYQNDTWNLTGFVAEAPDWTGFSGINFGTRHYNYPTDWKAVVENRGNYNLVINSITLTGADSVRFQILSGGSSGTLLPGETREIDVRYLTDGLGIHNAAVNVNFTYDGLDYAPDLLLTGETVYAPNAQIWLDDTMIAEETGTITGPGLDTLTLTIDHKYAEPCNPICQGTYADQTSDYHLKRGSTYVIVSDFGGSKNGRLLKKIQRKLEKYRTTLADTSPEVLTEALNVIGQTWMQQTTLSERLLYQLLDVEFVKHHGFGIVADESAINGGYYVDVRTQFIHAVSRYNDTVDEDAGFKASGFLTSAMEHGVLEQLQGAERPAASTVKLLYLANSDPTQNQRIYLADDATDYLNNIKPNLTGYNFDKDLNGVDDFEEQIENGAIFVLPASGKIRLEDWEGEGYVRYYRSPDGSLSEMGMIIGIDYTYFGAYSAFDEPIWVPSIFEEFFSGLASIFGRDYPKSKDPVNMTTGAFLYEGVDLSLGGAEPRGLHFGRNYNSEDSNSKTTLGYGWTHSYNIYLKVHSDVEAGLAMRQPVDAAAMLASSIVTLDLMVPSDPNLKEWMTAVLTGKWAMDQLFENAVSVHLKDKVLTYLELPDGTYNRPPGVTTELINNSGSYFLEERFGTKIYFQDVDPDPVVADQRISEWRDVDDNIMTFTYNGDKLETVRDAYNRTLTLNYSGTLLSSVDDSTGRTVRYNHTGDDLTEYRDPEDKPWGYAYTDTNYPHHITDLTNPLSITTATNAYDSLGRVMTQQVPRQTGIGTYANVTYNFYFTGYVNAEEDPDGYFLTYYFDEKGRQVGQENQTGSYVSSEYDGQDHVVRTVNPRGYETVFMYDGYQNLIRTTNALTQSTDNVYDLKFRLTDTIDPLFHGTHIEYDSEHHPELLQYGADYIYDSAASTFVMQNNGLFEASATYYDDGLTETTTDGRGKITTLTYTGNYGRPKTTTVQGHNPLTTDYNARGLMTKLTDQVGAETNFPVYNKRGQLERKTDPLLRDTNMHFNDAGRLDYIIDRKGERTDYTYTPTGKIETITYQNDPPVTFLYDNDDNVREMQDATGITTYVYYPDHRLQTMTDPHGFQMDYVYDEAGNLTEFMYPGNKKVIYTYDELNRLKTVMIDWLSSKPTATYYYDDAGRLDYVENFNGTVTDYDYDNANRLTDLVNRRAGGSIIADYHFTVLDGNGNRTQVVKNEPLSPALVLSSTSYEYNDPVKNRLEGTDGVPRFSYNYEGQLYTKDGSLYRFDNEHRLKRIDDIASIIQFDYDGKGNRLKVARNGVETRYVYDAAGNLLAEADSSNVIAGYYIYGMGLMAMVTPSDEVYTYHFDAVGSTVAITDSGENIRNMYAYLPFGELSNETEDFQQPFKYVGQHGVITDQNGMYYMRARYYDPEVGRFISEDPIGFDGGDVNLFAYVGNNPILLFDPFGLSEETGSFGQTYWNSQIGSGAHMTMEGIEHMGQTMKRAGEIWIEYPGIKAALVASQAYLLNAKTPGEWEAGGSRFTSLDRRFGMRPTSGAEVARGTIGRTKYLGRLGTIAAGAAAFGTGYAYGAAVSSLFQAATE